MPEHETVSTAQQRNAFEVMMQSSNERKCPKRVHSSGTKAVLEYCGTVLIETCTSVATYLLVGDTELRGDHLVRNKLLDLLEEMKVGWTPDAVDSIRERFVKQLTNTLWYLDSHHQKFSSRNIHLPKEFSSFQGFNNWKRRKIKQPALTSPELECHVRAPSGILSQPWIAKNEYSELKSLLEKLMDGMHKYMNYLTRKNDEM